MTLDEHVWISVQNTHYWKPSKCKQNLIHFTFSSICINKRKSTSKPKSKECSSAKTKGKELGQCSLQIASWNNNLIRQCHLIKVFIRKFKIWHQIFLQISMGCKVKKLDRFKHLQMGGHQWWVMLTTRSWQILQLNIKGYHQCNSNLLKTTNLWWHRILKYQNQN